MSIAGEGSSKDSHAILVARKFDIIKTEWSYIQSEIKEEIDRKDKNRTWAVTALSATFALSLYHNDPEIILLFLPICAFFWYLDASRQAKQNVLLERDRAIAAVLRNPTEADLLEFEAPLFGDMLGDKTKHNDYHKKAIFGKVRSLFFGCMMASALIIYLILHYRWL